MLVSTSVSSKESFFKPALSIQILTEALIVEMLVESLFSWPHLLPGFPWPRPVGRPLPADYQSLGRLVQGPV